MRLLLNLWLFNLYDWWPHLLEHIVRNASNYFMYDSWVLRSTSPLTYSSSSSISSVEDVIYKNVWILLGGSLTCEELVGEYR